MDKVGVERLAVCVTVGACPVARLMSHGAQTAVQAEANLGSPRLWDHGSPISRTSASRRKSLATLVSIDRTKATFNERCFYTKEEVIARLLISI